MSTQFAPIWNNASVDFTCIRANVTDTNSGSNSTLLDLLVGGVSKFKVDKGGNANASNFYSIANDVAISFSATQVNLLNKTVTAWRSLGCLDITGYGNLSFPNGGGTFGYYLEAQGLKSSTQDVGFFFDSLGFNVYNKAQNQWRRLACGDLLVAGTSSKLDISDTTGAGSGSLQASAINIAQTWNTTGTPTAFKLNVTDTASNAASLFAAFQFAGVSRYEFAKTAFRLYNTADAGLNNYERAKIAWSSNVLQIGTEKLGTGAARALELQTDGTTRLTIGTTGKVGIGTTSPSLPVHVIADATTGAGVAVQYSGAKYMYLAAGGSGATFAFDNSGYFAIYAATGITGDSGVDAKNYYKVFGNTGNTLIGNNSYNTADTGWKLDITHAGSNGYFRSGGNSQILGTLDLGHASDTTLSRVSAGVVAIEGNNILTETLGDGRNIIAGTTTGTKIGTATTQKLGFWNATPDVQPTTAVAAATLVGGGGNTITDTDTFDGYTLKQIVKALRNIGLLA